MCNQSSLEILPISSGDCVEFYGLTNLAKCFAEAFGRSDLGAIEFQIRQELVENHHYLVSVLDQTVYGFVSWRTWFEPRHRLAELVHIGTKPFQGLAGVGTKLVLAMEEQVHAHYRELGYSGARKILLFTHQQNEAAQRFYNRLGYQALSGQDGLPAIITEFTREGVDEIMMIKAWPEHRLIV